MSSADDMGALARDITAMGTRAQSRAAMAMGKALADIEAGAKTRAPVDTGNLRNSISRQTTARGAVLRGEVGPTANYAAHVENGTSRQRAQPYLRPATDAVVPGYEAALEQLGEL